MPTIVKTGGGVPVQDYEALQAQLNSLNSEYSNYKSSHSHTDAEYAQYGSDQYAAGAANKKTHVKVYVQAEADYKYAYVYVDGSKVGEMIVDNAWNTGFGGYTGTIVDKDF